MEKQLTIGDVFSRISEDLNKELSVLLNGMGNIHPELNTVATIDFIYSSRKKLKQLLAIIRWLSSKKTSDVLKSVGEFRSDLNSLNTDYSRASDQLFYVHCSIFSMRSPKFAVENASSCIIQEIGIPLPKIVQNRGLKDYPKFDNDLATSIQSKVKLSIRRKLAACNSKRIFVHPFSAKWTPHPLILSIDNVFLFNIHLTLYQSNENSPWRIIRYKYLCNESRIIEGTLNLRRKRKFEQDITEDYHKHQFSELSDVINFARCRSLETRIIDYAEEMILLSKEKLYINCLSAKEAIIDAETTSFTFNFWRSDFSK
jgi:hypothetical protein